MSELPRKSATDKAFPPIGGGQDKVQVETEAPRESSKPPFHNVRTRFGFPVYVPTQQRLIRPGTICPIVIDDWVQNQLSLEHGSLVIED